MTFFVLALGGGGGASASRDPRALQARKSPGSLRLSVMWGTEPESCCSQISLYLEIEITAARGDRKPVANSDPSAHRCALHPRASACVHVWNPESVSIKATIKVPIIGKRDRESIFARHVSFFPNRPDSLALCVRPVGSARVVQKRSRRRNKVRFMSRLFSRMRSPRLVPAWPGRSRS